MPISALAKYRDIGQGNYNLNSLPISRITIHNAYTVGNCDKLSSILRHNGECTWHYGIGNDGIIGAFVDELDRTSGTGDANNDTTTINIQVCNSSSNGWTISEEAYTSLVELCADICLRNNISSLKYTGKLKGSNLTLHRWYNSKTSCPEKSIESRLPSLVTAVNSKLDMDANKREEYLADYKIAVNPYIAHIPATMEHIDTKRLTDNGVVGVTVDVGQAYDVVHLPTDKYANPLFTSQVTQLSKSKLPYAGMLTVRARSVEEADIETKALKSALNFTTWPLGIWLKLDLGNSSKHINDMILTKYYNFLDSQGFGQKCGIFADRRNIEKFNWANFCTMYYLWIDDNVSNVEVLDAVLVPELFVI